MISYHERTKHSIHQYARSPGYLDWANQPNPFRRYEDVPLMKLPLIEKDPDSNYLNLFERKGNPFQPISLRNIGFFMELSMGLSAWKSYEASKWVLRINPSSGNLHPTEAYLILPFSQEDDCEGGVYHYNPYFHALEMRAEIDKRLELNIKKHFQMDGFFVGLSSIYWRESWKYGERAFRYCNLDAGHAMACLSFSANLLGWKVTYLNALSDSDIESMLGFHKTRWKKFEKDTADNLCFVHNAGETSVPRGLPSEIIQSFKTLSFNGEPNLLSNDHVDWDVIDKVSLNTAKSATSEMTYRYDECDFYEKGIPSITGAAIIRQRRSGQFYDGKTLISKEAFFAMLDKTIPRNNCAPFDLELGQASIHLVIFINRVSGLEPGLYFLIREKKDSEEIKQKCNPDFLWQTIKDAPNTLPLYLLKQGDLSHDAALVSCQQDIAGKGNFSLGMIAKFRNNLENQPHLYRHLHWEAGMIGQILYLEAEAHSVRGTGIGCFFDDAMHEILGLSDNDFQDIYHFTIGKSLEDTRLSTLAPYQHLKDQ